MTSTKLTYKAYGDEDRFTHNPENDPWWQESVFLGWADADAEIGGIIRLGLEANWNDGQGRVTLWSGVTTPRHGLYHRTDHLPFGPDSRSERGWNAAGVATFNYAPDDSLRGRWTLEDEGILLALETEDLHTPKASFPSADGWSMKERQVKDHLECGVKVTGEITLAGRTFQINGGGYRDHSWGPRHWDTITAHRWMTGTLGNGISFGIMSWLNIDNTLFRSGMLVNHATNEASYTNDVDTIVFVEADGCSHRGGVAVMRMPDGKEYKFEFEPIGKAPVSWHEHVACLDAPCRITCGNIKGVGILETTTNAQQGKIKPQSTMVSGTVANGIYTNEEDVVMQRPFGDILSHLNR